MVRIWTSAITTSGILATIFLEGRVVKIITAVVSIITLCVNSYFKVYDLKKLQQQHKKAALELLEIGQDLVSLLCDIKMKKCKEEEIGQRRDKIFKRLIVTHKNSPDFSFKAINKTIEDVKSKTNNNYADKEIDNFLPTLLRKDK